MGGGTINLHGCWFTYCMNIQSRCFLSSAVNHFTSSSPLCEWWHSYARMHTRTAAVRFDCFSLVRVCRVGSEARAALFLIYQWGAAGYSRSNKSQVVLMLAGATVVFFIQFHCVFMRYRFYKHALRPPEIERLTTSNHFECLNWQRDQCWESVSPQCKFSGTLRDFIHSRIHFSNRSSP